MGTTVKSILIVMGIALTAMGAAQAENETDGNKGFFEFGGGAMLLDDPSVVGVVGRAGYHHPVSSTLYLGVEGEGNFGLSSETVEGVDFELKNALGAYLVLSATTGSGGSFFGRIGFHETTFTGEYGGLSLDLESSGFSGGVGFNWYMNDTWSVRTDATYFHYDEFTSAGVVTEVDDGSTILSVAMAARF